MRAGASSGRRAATAAALFLLLGAASLRAQAAEASPSGDALPKLEEAKEENPVSRFEIVSLGSFPITIFYVGFAFDLQRYLASGNDPYYAPWPFKTSYSAPLSDSDRLTRLGVALGVSCAIGAIDAIIHASKVRAAKRLREARMEIDSGSEGPRAPTGSSAAP